MMLFLLISCRGNMEDTSKFVQPMEPIMDTGTKIDTNTPQSEIFHFGDDAVEVQIEEISQSEIPLLQYTITSTHPQRDNGPSEIFFEEQEGDPLLRSGNILTDALFALAVEEARRNSVSEISDDSFRGSTSCECFVTGELWHWVWTRDISYAVELGLAWLDPQRSANSLLFKLSDTRDGDGLQIVQDTGTGGSWPVSTDRVTWIRGAMAVLKYTDHPELKEATIEAIRNTADLDRRYVFDPTDGLYYGETSFLDWREQSYPTWVKNNPVHIAMSKSLSTNLNHLFLLRSLEELTGEVHNSEALATAIDNHFWQGTYYSSYKSTELNPAPVENQDMLGTALAVLDLQTHPEVMQHYPHGQFGPPVIWPQQQHTPIYHNRAVWPFVTAYSILAARQANNQQVFEHNLNSLIKLAALNLSHMENYEWQTGSNWYEDGDDSGPVLNSRRQLWSVAGFLGAIAHGVFGIKKENNNWKATPIKPNNWFTDEARLIIDGVELFIGDANPLDEGSISIVDESDWKNYYGAQIPEVILQGNGSNVTLSFSSTENAIFDVYRDGVKIAENTTSPFMEEQNGTACYSVVAKLVHASQPSEPSCWWGENYHRIQFWSASDFEVVGGTWSTNHGRAHYQNWGEKNHSISLNITPNNTGKHALQAVYGNGSGPINTGVTAAVKWVKIFEEDTPLSEGPWIMPHLGSWDIWKESNFVWVHLEADKEYRLEVSDGFNMSYLQHYIKYNGNGGGNHSYNYVNIAEIKLLSGFE